MSLRMGSISHLFAFCIFNVQSVKKSLRTKLAKELNVLDYYSKDDLVVKLETYIHKCAKLCWRLVTHNPPLIIPSSLHSGRSNEVILFDQKKHQVSHDPDIVKGLQGARGGRSVISEIIWPALVDSEGKFIRKAEVILEDSAV